tara:strand:+ start:9180 stop:9311 length:132 start_codon:yes stop_codon:yes gene_type:complete
MKIALSPKITEIRKMRFVIDPERRLFFIFVSLRLFALRDIIPS